MVNSPSTPTSSTSTRGRPEPERFAAYVQPDLNGCHIWTGTLQNGQGYFKAGPWNDQRTVLAHRYAWEHEHGPIPTGQTLVHLCGYRACCNPEHLAIRTPRPKSPATTQATSVPRMTERDMVDLLTRRYTRVSMGAQRYAYADHVANTTGWATRIADFVAVDCHGRGYGQHRVNEIHGHEIKVSRADWLRELKDPSKAEAWRPYVHRWWLVAADRSIVRDGELPDGWGLLVKTGDQLRAVRRASLLSPQPMPSGMLAAFARAVAKTARKDTTE